MKLNDEIKTQKCLECGFESSTIMGLAIHIKSIHGLSRDKYNEKYGLQKFCVKCNNLLNSKPYLMRKRKTQLCKKCSDLSRHGSNNPFYGKTHSKETIESMKEKCKVETEKLWKNPEYRKKVIDGTSKPRRARFKTEQSERITQWFKDNPEQREIRSKLMKRTWAEGNIVPTINSVNESKQEIKLREMLKEYCPVEKKTIKIGTKWFFPDAMIGNKIVEFYGTLWHADPTVYKAEDVVHHKITAKQIWERDAERINRLKDDGYEVMIVWQKEFSKDKIGKCIEAANFLKG